MKELRVDNENPYKMSVDLNVIRHLGVGLYNSNPVVIAEAVANSWDADATRVDIRIIDNGSVIEIEDNGHGMDRAQVNGRFLNIGYERRREQGQTSENGRVAMGRKGIGKLSLFAIADDITVSTKRIGGQVEAFCLNSDDIRNQITSENPTYYPAALKADWEPASGKGTKIILRQLKRNAGNSSKYLRERLARRFSVIGNKNNFQVFVDSSEITVSDRGYLKHVEYVWNVGKNDTIKDLVSETTPVMDLPSDSVSGWIGTVKKPSQLKESGKGQSANGIVIMVRGRVAHENILDTIGEAGIYAQYVVGELHADFLDPDDKDDPDDPITSSRQLLREDDPRVTELREHIRLLLKSIERDWTKFRNDAGVEEAKMLPSISEWFEGLDKDSRSQATKLFGKINTIRFNENELDERADLFRYGVIAFEKMRAQRSLFDLENISSHDVVGFLRAFQQVDEVESALYHETVKGRLAVIRKYQKLVDENALEKVLQEQLFQHLWLIEPSWDRVTGITEMETSITGFLKTNKGVSSKEIEDSRMDIVYRSFGGTHAVIEMKRPNVKTNVYRLLEQIDKYRVGLKEHLSAEHQIRNPFVRTIILVKKEPEAWVDKDKKSEDISMLHRKDAEVLTYRSMLNNAAQVYQQFLDHDIEVKRISKILNKIQEEIGISK